MTKAALVAEERSWRRPDSAMLIGDIAEIRWPTLMTNGVHSRHQCERYTCLTTFDCKTGVLQSGCEATVCSGQLSLLPLAEWEMSSCGQFGRDVIIFTFASRLISARRPRLTLDALIDSEPVTMARVALVHSLYSIALYSFPVPSGQACCMSWRVEPTTSDPWRTLLVTPSSLTTWRH